VTADRGARSYLLGQLSDDESSALEREYFADEAALDRIAVAEEELVEDYLAGRLPAEERHRFERHYLASPPHRARVETIRRLQGAGIANKRRATSLRYLALAATLVLAVGALWLGSLRRSATVAVVAPPAASPPQAVPEPRRGFAVSLSPLAVRSASDSQSVVVPDGTDVVALQLEGGADTAKSANARAVIQTVTGDEVWRGPAHAGTTLAAGVIARFDVPASRLGIDDYVVVLFDTDGGGAERERNRYVLRLRAR